MGNYTVRTKDDQDAKIRDAVQYMQEATVSKAFLTALLAYEDNQETIRSLRRELEQQQMRSRQVSGAINDFESSMARLFAMK